MPDQLIHAGSIAFDADVGAAEAALSRHEGLQDVCFVRSGPCHEYPNLTRYVVEIHGEHDATRAKEWMDRAVQALEARVGAMHCCVG